MSQKALTVREVSRLTDDGTYALGGVSGLSLRIRDGQKTYIYRYQIGGRRSLVTIGRYDSITLSDARQKASEFRSRVKAGEHIGDAKKAAKVATEKAQREEKEQQARALLTFQVVARMWLDERERFGAFNNYPLGYTNSIRTLEKYVAPVIGSKRIDEVTERDIFAVLKPIWTTTVAVKRRALDLIRGTLRWAKAKGLRTGDNPADLKGSLGVLLEQLGSPTVHTEHRPCLHWERIPDFMLELHNDNNAVSRLIEFSILTAARINQAICAKWEDIDLDAGTWSCPEVTMKMKGRGRFVVQLSTQAVELLKSLPRISNAELVFSTRTQGQISAVRVGERIHRLHKRAVEKGGTGWIDPDLSERLGKPVIITQHGTARATFQTWCRTGWRLKEFDNDAVRLCLAHIVGNSVDRAYDHSAMNEERRRIMQAWGDWCWSKISN